MTRLTVKLVGLADADGSVYFTDFRGFCAILNACLKATEGAITPGKQRVRYKIVGLKAESAELTLETVPPIKGRDMGSRVVSAFTKTVKALQAGKKPDRRLGIEALEAYRKLASPLDHHAAQIWIDATRVTSTFSRTIDKILGSVLPSEGFATGRLDRVNVHDRLEFILYPPVGGYAIACAFDDQLLPKVRRALRRNVTASGRFYFRENSAYPDRAIIRDIEVHPDDADLPTLGSLRGISPGCTGDLTAVEFVRALRDA